jgi:hypothetical protein
MSKRTLSVTLLLVALASPVFAAPNDDQNPGPFSRISRVIAKIVRVLIPQGDVDIPHP